MSTTHVIKELLLEPRIELMSNALMESVLNVESLIVIMCVVINKNKIYCWFLFISLIKVQIKQK